MKFSKYIDAEGKPLNQNIIHRGDQFLIALSEYLHKKPGLKLSEILTEKVKRIDKNDFSYRIINYWEQNGLLNAEREGGTGWRKISLLDYVWLKIIGRLREFGMSIEKLKTFKHKLETLSSPDSRLFEFYTARALVPRDLVYVLAFPDGQAEIATKGEYVIAINMQSLDDHIRISINEILQEIFPEKDLSPSSSPSVNLTPEELSLLAVLRFEEYESVNVIKEKKGGGIDRIQISKRENAEEKIKTLLQSGDYQHIEIVQKNGKVVQIKRTESRRL